MIGLGSNRLSVCRRGGMSVTQAGKGGMEWLAGGRGVSPYSAQATAALKAQFPTQWPTIRDYGFAHPEIVGYMNAYAPEDAKIAYSLVEGIGVRAIWNEGTAAFIDTGMNYAAGYKITHIYNDASGSSLNGVLDSNAISWGGRNNNYAIMMPGGITSTGVAKDDRYHTMVIESGKQTFDGTQFATISASGHTANTITLSAQWSVSANRYWTNYQGKHAHYYHERNGVLLQHLIPFKLGVARSADQVYPSSKGAQAVGTLGMLDLVTGLFHPNANSSGSFSESIETPAS